MRNDGMDFSIACVIKVAICGTQPLIRRFAPPSPIQGGGAGIQSAPPARGVSFSEPAKSAMPPGRPAGFIRISPRFCVRLDPESGAERGRRVTRHPPHGSAEEDCVIVHANIQARPLSEPWRHPAVDLQMMPRHILFIPGRCANGPAGSPGW